MTILTQLFMLIKNIVYTLWGLARVLLPVTHIFGQT